ncbi:MAG: undecaprenyl-diphosphate phosphatase [Aigarchaeota archaeon]|nr:undecaprenyl-diphosphate phosphatase [Aigarchaeota archaeon]
MFDKLILGFLSGLIQGVTEWLPISSKTILFFIYYAWGLSAVDSYILSIFLNGSTFVAATIYFRRELSRMLKVSPKIFSSNINHDVMILKFLIISSIVTGIIGIPLSFIPLSILEKLNPRDILIFIGILLMVTAFINLWRTRIGIESKSIHDVSIRDAVIVGFTQSLSVLPGISRSGITILALALCGFKIEDSLTLSFLMSIPVTLGGSIYMYLTSPRVLEALQPHEILISISTAIIISIITISILLKLSRRFKSHIFLTGLSILTILSGILST